MLYFRWMFNIIFSISTELIVRNDVVLEVLNNVKLFVI